MGIEFDNAPKPEVSSEQYRESFKQAQQGEFVNPADITINPTEETPTEDVVTPEPTQESQPVEQLGDISEYFDVATGKVKQEYWDKANIPEGLRQHVEAGLRAEAAKARQIIVDSAGGEEVYKSASEWADKNWSQGQKDAFNEALNKGVESAKLAVAGLMGQYNSQNKQASAPRVVEGNSSGSPVGDTFNDMSEYLKALGSPEYKSSPAFRQKITDKLLRSKQAGKIR